MNLAHSSSSSSAADACFPPPPPPTRTAFLPPTTIFTLLSLAATSPSPLPLPSTTWTFWRLFSLPVACFHSMQIPRLALLMLRNFRPTSSPLRAPSLPQSLSPSTTRQPQTSMTRYPTRLRPCPPPPAPSTSTSLTSTGCSRPPPPPCSSCWSCAPLLHISPATTSLSSPTNFASCPPSFLSLQCTLLLTTNPTPASQSASPSTAAAASPTSPSPPTTCPTSSVSHTTSSTAPSARLAPAPLSVSGGSLLPPPSSPCLQTPGKVLFTTASMCFPSSSCRRPHPPPTALSPRSSDTL